MAYDAKTERLIALKKLAGKAQTSNDKGLANEALPSGLTLSAETVFGEPISTAPTNASLYDITGKVEYLRFQTSFIAGSDTSSGRHGFELKLPADYESSTSNPLAGTYPFTNNQVINITSGTLQLIPPSFATTYEGKPFYGGTAAKDSGTQVPVLDARDWYLDYFNGVFFQQDPPGTGDHANNPDYLQGFLYIGEMLDTVVKNSGSSGGGGGATDVGWLGPSPGQIDTTGSLGVSGSLSLTQAINRIGETGSKIDFQPGQVLLLSGGAGSSADPTSFVDTNFFVSGTIGSRGSSTKGMSAFGGDLLTSGSLFALSGVSGSLTRLVDGSSYLVAGAGISITSASSGQVTISSNFGTLSRLKSVYEVTQSHGSMSTLVLPNIDFSNGNNNPNLIDIFLNGQLLVSGTQAQATAGSVDYTLILPPVTGSLKFGFILERDDTIVSVITNNA